jgi:hypothetical protein
VGWLIDGLHKRIEDLSLCGHMRARKLASGIQRAFCAARCISHIWRVAVHDGVLTLCLLWVDCHATDPVHAPHTANAPTHHITHAASPSKFQRSDRSLQMGLSSRTPTSLRPSVPRHGRASHLVGDALCVCVCVCVAHGCRMQPHIDVSLQCQYIA